MTTSGHVGPITGNPPSDGLLWLLSVAISGAIA